MAPESSRKLVVLDCTRTDSGFRAHVDRWDPQETEILDLDVSWAGTGKPAGSDWHADGNEAVWVRVPDGYAWSEHDNAEVSAQEPNQLQWTDATDKGFLMLVAVMPPGYVVDAERGGDAPHQVKVVSDRLVAWWAIMPPGATRRWYVRELGAAEVLNDVAAKLQ